MSGNTVAGVEPVSAFLFMAGYLTDGLAVKTEESVDAVFKMTVFWEE